MEPLSIICKPPMQKSTVFLEKSSS